MKARGVPKKFSEEERQKRRDRLEKARNVRLQAMAGRKRKREALKKLIKAGASVGVFVPVQDWE